MVAVLFRLKTWLMFCLLLMTEWQTYFQFYAGYGKLKQFIIHRLSRIFVFYVSG